MKGLENPVAKNAQKFAKGSGRHGGPKKYNRKEKHRGDKMSPSSFLDILNGIRIYRGIHLYSCWLLH